MSSVIEVERDFHSNRYPYRHDFPADEEEKNEYDDDELYGYAQAENTNNSNHATSVNEWMYKDIIDKGFVQTPDENDKDQIDVMARLGMDAVLNRSGDMLYERGMKIRPGGTERIDASELARKTIPPPYFPPKTRLRYRMEANEDEETDHEEFIKVYCDIEGERRTVPIFKVINENEVAAGTQIGGEILRYTCSCDDKCGERCECRAKSRGVQLNENGVSISFKADYGYFNSHLSLCGDSCNCNHVRCRNRITWKQKPSELEIVKRNKKMGFEMLSLRHFSLGDIVTEFTGIYINRLSKTGEEHYSFRLYDSREEDKSEDHAFGEIPDVFMVYINPFSQGSHARFAAHSNFPNMMPLKVYQSGDRRGAPRLFFIATFTILPREFLTICYGEEWAESIRCQCDERLCHDEDIMAMIESGLALDETDDTRGDYVQDVIREREYAKRRMMRKMQACFLLDKSIKIFSEVIEEEMKIEETEEEWKKRRETMERRLSRLPKGVGLIKLRLAEFAKLLKKDKELLVEEVEEDLVVKPLEYFCEDICEKKDEKEEEEGEVDNKEKDPDYEDERGEMKKGRRSNCEKMRMEELRMRSSENEEKKRRKDKENRKDEKKKRRGRDEREEYHLEVMGGMDKRKRRRSDIIDVVKEGAHLEWRNGGDEPPTRIFEDLLEDRRWIEELEETEEIGRRGEEEDEFFYEE